MATSDVVAGLTAALQVGAVTADVVAVEARRHARLHDLDRAAEGGSGSERHDVARTTALEQQGGRSRHRQVEQQRVVSLTQRRLADPAAVIAGLPPDRRPLPSVVGYDDLLRLHRTPGPDQPNAHTNPN